MSVLVNFCFDCGGQGTEVGCLNCGRKLGSLNMKSRDEKDAVQLVKKASFRKIPEEYLLETWDADKFRKLYRGDKNNLLLENNLIKKLEMIHNHFARGFIPSKGAVIIAPAMHSKRTFAFSCMQFALDNGHSVAPLLSTLELQRLIVLSAENPKYQLYKEITYDEYIMSDVVFVTVTQTAQHKNAYSVLEEILSIRSAKGLATFILSRYSLEELSTWDRSKNLVKFKTMDAGANYKKFPAIIEYNK